MRQSPGSSQREASGCPLPVELWTLWPSHSNHVSQYLQHIVLRVALVCSVFTGAQFHRYDYPLMWLPSFPGHLEVKLIPCGPKPFTINCTVSIYSWVWPKSSKYTRVCFFFFYFILEYFYWNVVDLQCCISFRYKQSGSVIHMSMCLLFQILFSYELSQNIG